MQRSSEVVMIKGLVLLFLMLLLSGCAGLGAATYGKNEIVRSEFGLYPVRNEFSFKHQTYTPDEVVSLWGEPDSRELEGECTVFGFKGGTSWSGAGLFVVVIPVPVAVPSGKYWSYIYFRDGESVGAISEYGELKSTAGIICGSNECLTGVHTDVNAPEVSAEESVEAWCTLAES